MLSSYPQTHTVMRGVPFPGTMPINNHVTYILRVILLLLHRVSIQSRLIYQLLLAYLLHLTLDRVQGSHLCTMLQILLWGVFNKTLHVLGLKHK